MSVTNLCTYASWGGQPGASGPLTPIGIAKNINCSLAYVDFPFIQNYKPIVVSEDGQTLPGDLANVLVNIFFTSGNFTVLLPSASTVKAAFQAANIPFQVNASFSFLMQANGNNTTLQLGTTDSTFGIQAGTNIIAGFYQGNSDFVQPQRWVTCTILNANPLAANAIIAI